MKHRITGHLSALVAVLIAGLLLPHAATADDGWTQAEKDGFAASAFITTDKDWKEKWYTPSNGGLRFNVIDRLKLGEEATLLVGFNNAARDADGKINVRCDLEITKPDGSSGGSARDAVCAPPDLPDVPDRIIPTFMTVSIKADEEPVGKTLFEIGVTDAVAGTRVDLELTLNKEAAE